MSLAGAFLSWLILQALYGGFLPAIHRTAGEFGMRVASIVLGAIVYSLLIGLFQAKTLGGATEGSRWTGWMWCRLAGALLSSSLLLLFRDRAWSVTDLRSWALVASVAALAGGGLTGLLQSLVLYRKLGPPAWAVGWTLLTAGASALGSLAGVILYHALISRPGAALSMHYVAGFTQMVAVSVVSSALTGFPLGRWFQRHPALSR